MYNLCKKDVPFKWTDECEKSFLEFKNLLAHPPILSYPDFTKEFILHTDASNIAVGAVLSQGTLPHDKPIHYFSKTLNPAQTRYSTIEKELLAIILAVENFNHYLTGREFLIVTDHRPLTFLFNTRNMNARLHRWRYILMEYKFKVIYRSGTQNVVADALSRIEIKDNDDTSQNSTDDLTIPSILVQTRAQRRNDMEMQLENNSQNDAEQNEKQECVSISEEADNDVIHLDSEQEETHDEIEKRNANRKKYLIKEKRNILLQSNEMDHIFFIFHKENCELHKKLQHKLKKVFVLCDLSRTNDFYNIDTNRSIIILNNIIRSDTEKTKTKNTMNNLMKFCTQKCFENIAINVDFADYQSYFEFKLTLKEFFQSTNICITIYLNKIIEITDLQEIDQILRQYHDSVLSGHTGAERMINNIRQHYWWTGLTKDVKNYVK